MCLTSFRLIETHLQRQGVYLGTPKSETSVCLDSKLYIQTLLNRRVEKALREVNAMRQTLRAC